MISGKKAVLIVLPIVALVGTPLLTHAKTFADLVNGDVVPLGNKLIELLYALTFLFFLVGMVRLFFADSAEKRAQGRQFAIWGIFGLALLFAVWGLVRALLGILSSFAA